MILKYLDAGGSGSKLQSTPDPLQHSHETLETRRPEWGEEEEEDVQQNNTISENSFLPGTPPSKKVYYLAIYSGINL